MDIKTHPVQTSYIRNNSACVPKAVTLKAYQVYQKLYGDQRALIEGDCRGGFGVNELVAFLYAATFPECEWRERFDEAITGMKGI